MLHMVGRVTALWVVLTALIWVPVHAQMIMGLDHSVPTVVAGYSGPGDKVSGAVAWVGMRAYTAAIAAAGTQKVVNLKRASDNQTCDFLIATSGNVGASANCSGAFGTGNSYSSFCNATTCRIVTWYDQTGNSNDVSNASGDSTKPVFTINELNGQPCAAYTAASSQFLTNAGSPTVPQPFTFAGVAYSTGADGAVTGAATVSSGANDVRVGYRAGPTYGGYAGNSFIVSGSTTFNAFHRVQMEINSPAGATNSYAYVDGVAGSTGNAGTDTLGGWAVGDNPSGTPLDGFVCEMGLWPSALSSANNGLLDTNMKSYWGL